MSGAGDEAERDLLRAGQVSKRLAQLRAVLDVVSRDLADAGRTAGLWESFDALAGVQRSAPDTVRDLLSGPQVGAWAAWCLRRLRHDGHTPIRVHLAHLGSIAAAAAVLAGARIRVRVPARAGVVSLPSVGRARVPARTDWALVECVTAPDGVLLDGTEPVEWAPVRVLRAEAGGVELCTRLDELDPYWRSFGIPVRDRLGDEEVAHWQDCLAGAWRILATRHPHRLVTLAAAIRCLVPVEQTGRLGRVSASSADASGAVALTEPANATRLAATLIHESQHYRLNALHDLRPLHREPPGRNLLYSPWRNDPRGVFGVLHGIQAFLAVADFWRRERSGPVADLEYARHVGQLRAAVDVVTRSGDLTPFGRSLVASLGAAVDSLPSAEGSPEVRRMAVDLVDEHRASWRLRNVVPNEVAVRAVAHALRRGEPIPTDETDDADDTDRVARTEPSGDNPLIRLVLARLENGDEMRALAEDPVAFAARFPGATPADVHLVDGDYPTTRRAALARIEAGTAGCRDWAALTVAHGRLCLAPSPLVRRPELVRAAWERLPAGAQTSPAALLAGYEAGTSTSESIRR